MKKYIIKQLFVRLHRRDQRHVYAFIRDFYLRQLAPRRRRAEYKPALWPITIKEIDTIAQKQEQDKTGQNRTKHDNREVGKRWPDKKQRKKRLLYHRNWKTYVLNPKFKKYVPIEPQAFTTTLTEKPKHDFYSTLLRQKVGETTIHGSTNINCAGAAVSYFEKKHPWTMFTCESTGLKTVEITRRL